MTERASTERVTIERLGAAGDGIASTPEGPLYVADALPGERMLVERHGQRARVVERLSSSPDRAEPFCPYYDRCGGCVAQHMAAGLYGGWKRERLLLALSRAGLAVPVAPLVDAHGEGRRRVTFHARTVEGRTEVGFMERGTHRLVPIERCPVTEPRLSGAARAARVLAGALARIRKPLDVAVTATAAGLDVDLRGSGPPGERLRQELVRLAGELDLARLSVGGDTILERRPPSVAMGRAFGVPPPGGFLQATARGEELIGNAAVSAATGARRVLDLFAGAGPLSLRLAERAEVHAVEVDAGSVAALDRAARATPGLRRIMTERRDLFRRPLLPPELDRFEAVVLDPPRAGAEAQAAQLALSACSTVIMVSCDPETFVRDAVTLVAAGMKAESVLPVDQFRWSAHLEMIGVFRREPARRRSRQG